MLSITQFNQSKRDVQASETHLKGEHIYTHILEEGGIILYSYDDYFIEVHYDARFQSVVKFAAIDIFDAAEKYVSNKEFMQELVEV